MPGFSFTAPIITIAEEEQERRELSPAELARLEEDLFGPPETTTLSTPSTDENTNTNDNDNNNNVVVQEDVDPGDDDEGEAKVVAHSTSTMDAAGAVIRVTETSASTTTSGETSSSGSVEDLLHQVQQTILQMTPLEQRDYMEAMEQVPHLVQTESNPTLMLQCEENNVPLTALRLTRYWKTRRKLFGPTRAFLPMTLGGAMLEDSEALQKGFVVMLPQDQKGRGVLFYDRIRAVPAVASRDSVARVLFYMMQLATTLEPTTQERGIVVIKNLQGYDLYTHFDRILAKAEMACFGDCFPAKLRAFHICAGSGKWVVELILPVMKQIAGKYIRLRTVCHTGSCADVLQELRRYHLVPESLSVVLGGAIQFHPRLQWVQEQQQQEEQQQRLVEEREDEYRQFQPQENMTAVETEEAFGGGEAPEQGEDAALGVHDTDKLGALGETV